MTVNVAAGTLSADAAAGNKYYHKIHYCVFSLHSFPLVFQITLSILFLENKSNLHIAYALRADLCAGCYKPLLCKRHWRSD